MRVDQLATHWRILPDMESRKQRATVAEFPEQEDCSAHYLARYRCNPFRIQKPHLGENRA